MTVTSISHKGLTGIGALEVICLEVGHLVSLSSENHEADTEDVDVDVALYTQMGEPLGFGSAWDLGHVYLGGNEVLAERGTAKEMPRKLGLSLRYQQGRTRKDHQESDVCAVLLGERISPIPVVCWKVAARWFIVVDL